MKKNKIKSIEIDSFRAFTGKVDLNFEVDGCVADIVVVYAPNGIGKTSTIEGVEWATTGSISRLESIFSNNKGNQKNPKEGYILKNRQSKKKIGSVSIELDNGTKIHRETKPKSNRNNDYCKGKTLDTVEDMEFFHRNILSQGSISKFSYEASSGGLFNSLLDKVESKEDIAIYNKLNETQSRIEKSNSDIKVEITFIKDLILKENGEVEKIKSDYIDSSNFQKSASYSLFKHDFSFYEDLSLKKNSEIISYIREANTKLGNLKDKLSVFNIDYYRDSIINNLISSKVIKLQQGSVVKRNDLSKLKSDQEDLENKKKANSLFLGDEQLIEINRLISSYHDCSHRTEKCNTYLIKAKSTKQAILMSEKNIDFLTLKDKEKKLNNVESYLLTFFSNADGSKISLTEKNTFLDNINRKIQGKNDELNCVTRSTFIKAHSDDDEVDSLNKKSLALEEVNIKIKNLINEKEKIVSFDEKLELIKTYANEVINEKQLSNCPACGIQYDNVDQLLESISSFKSNSKGLVEGAISTLTEQKNEFISDIDKLTKIIDKRVSEERQNIQNKAQLLSERMQKFTEVYSVLDEFDIPYENVELKRVLYKIDLEKYTTKNKSTTASKLKQKYTGWNVKISEIINEEEDKLSQNKLDIKRINSYCFDLFDVDIKELLLISGSHHVLLFKNNEINTSISLIEKDIESIDSDIKKLDDKILSLCSKAGFDFDANFNKICEEAIQSKRVIRASYNYIKNNIKTYTIPKNEDMLNLVISLQDEFSAYLSHIETSQKLIIKNEAIISHKSDLENKKNSLKEGASRLKKVNNALDDVITYFSDLASDSINNEVLNDMFMYIEPHLKYDEISFKVELNGNNKGIYIQAKSSVTKDNNTPIYYLSEAQTNILSICIFLANHARESDAGINTIIIDDPVQSMDDLNSYALIDLCKIFARRFNKQIIITTHNRGFYNLFRDKLPETRYPTKFISL